MCGFEGIRRAVALARHTACFHFSIPLLCLEWSSSGALGWLVCRCWDQSSDALRPGLVEMKNRHHVRGLGTDDDGDEQWCAVGVGGVPDRDERFSWNGSLGPVERDEVARTPSGDAEYDHETSPGRSDVDGP